MYFLWQKNIQIIQKKVFLLLPLTGFPGHMVKTINEMKSNIKLIDIVCVVLDSRIPDSSKNDIIFDIAKEKPVILVFNKADLADEEKLKEKVTEYKAKGYETVLTNANLGQGINELVDKIREVGKKNKYSNKTSEEYKNITPIYRALISGVPNVGKSTIINKLAGKKAAEVGNKPGVTRAKQWIRLNNNIELLDTPGILWPKLTENNAGIKLALTGNIKEEILDIEELALYFVNYVRQNSKYLEMLKTRYKITENIEEMEDYEVFELIGKKRGAILKGNEVDYNKTAKIILDEFKAGIIGKINLE